MVSASDNGTLHVWRVDYATSVVGATKASLGNISGLTNFCKIDVSSEVRYYLFVNILVIIVILVCVEREG